MTVFPFQQWTQQGVVKKKRQDGGHDNVFEALYAFYVNIVT